ncbi:polyubiquitin binding protein-like protein [Microthyrium microscopicum]|uniref:Polyubiquitin binding protein-like protein n=1 Tax=Microthyrium microscopicum TaxID=703497 RepID=A0A6A6TXT7_9PEZI|nr:polyubiquitin binding protein-like protein [Microthyrium microscopicum]
MAQPFKLSACLSGHDKDVRGVSFPDPTLVISCSRDATVRLWKQESANPPRFDANISSSHGTTFVNTVAFVPPSSDFPDGLLVSGGGDGVLDVRSPKVTPDSDPDAYLPTHNGTICALSVSEDGSFFVSASWDTTAAIWRVGKWDEPVRLVGHESAVWDVLAYDDNTIVTASADKYLRVFNSTGKLLRRFQASEDVVRALVKLPPGHSSGAQFASAGNDNRIHFWTLEGVQMGGLVGHENYIYSLDILPTGELVSSSEDRTVRIWQNDKCIQTITHPAISVWSAAVCTENGDIVTGASDSIVRIFTRSADRKADEADIKAFDESVKASSIPQQALGEINKTDLPGPEFLTTKSGTKDGQVQMVKGDDGNVMAYQWSTQGNEWIAIGTVVDSAGSATKVTYNGQDYDYVFDVDIEEGKPALKLPYNRTQSPWEVARKFITDNKLPMTYIDSVVDFINQNTQGATIGTQSASNTAPGSDPYGTESRYRPGTTSSGSAPPEATKILPQKTYLAITTGSHKMIVKKIKEFNDELTEQRQKDLILQPADFQILSDAMAQLEPLAGKQEATLSIPPGAINAAIHAISVWPIDKRLPWLDVLRLLTAASADTITQIASTGDSLVDRLASAGALDTSVSPDNHIMLAIRTLANLFCSAPGRALADSSFDTILTLVEPFSTSSNKNLCIALTTLYINFASTDTSSRDLNGDADRALTLLSALTSLLNHSTDPEALYRALVAAGTVLYLGSDFVAVSKEGLEIEKAVERAEGVAKEGRITSLVKEIRVLLGKA